MSHCRFDTLNDTKPLFIFLHVSALTMTSCATETTPTCCETSLAATCPTASHCLCTLPPSTHPYTCLTVCSVSAVANCPSCSAPCNVGFSFLCTETDPYLRTLNILDVAMTHCDPSACASSVRNELLALQTATVPDEQNECRIEALTTAVFATPQQQRTLHTHLAITDTSLYTYATHHSLMRLLQCTPTSTTAACSTTSPATLWRTLFQVYSRLQMLVRRAELAYDLNRMECNSVRYALDQAHDDRRWDALDDGASNWWGGAQPQHPVTPDPRHQQHLNAVRDAADVHAEALTYVRDQYQDAQCHLVQAMNDTSVLTQCATITTAAQNTLATTLQRARTVLRNVSRFVERKALEQSWASSAFTPAGNPVRRTDPRLDTRLDDLAQLYVRTARNREMRNAIAGVLTQFYEAGTGNYTNNALVCSMFVARLGTVRRLVALADGGRW